MRTGRVSLINFPGKVESQLIPRSPRQMTLSIHTSSTYTSGLLPSDLVLSTSKKSLNKVSSETVWWDRTTS